MNKKEESQTADKTKNTSANTSTDSKATDSKDDKKPEIKFEDMSVTEQEAVLRALEKRNLDPTWVERMVEASKNIVAYSVPVAGGVAISYVAVKGYQKGKTFVAERSAAKELAKNVDLAS